MVTFEAAKKHILPTCWISGSDKCTSFDQGITFIMLLTKDTDQPGTDFNEKVFEQTE